jgi:hypothetical protein
LAALSGVRIVTRSQSASVLPDYKFTRSAAVGKGAFRKSPRNNGMPASNDQEFHPGRNRISETSAPEIFCSPSEVRTRPKTKPNMKTTTVQLPVRLTKRILLPGSGPPQPAGYPRFLAESRGRRSWYAFFRCLRAVLSRVLDRSVYDQISLGREVSVVFTAQGPVIYRYGWNSAVDVSPTGETNGKARFTKQS